MTPSRCPSKQSRAILKYIKAWIKKKKIGFQSKHFKESDAPSQLTKVVLSVVKHRKTLLMARTE